MSRLSDLYNALETLRKEGLPVTSEMRQKVDEAEEEYVKEEIVPALRQHVEPVLQKIGRPLRLVVAYEPGQPISVTLAHKEETYEAAGHTPDNPQTTPADTPGSPTDDTPEHPTADTPEPPTDDTPEDLGHPVVSEEKGTYVRTDHEPTKQITNYTKGLRVTFADGMTVCMPKAIDTFKAVLQRIGLERVSRLGIMRNGDNLVSREMRQPEPGRIFQHELGGWYIYSNMSNEDKKRDLETISERLGLNLTIEDGKPEP